MIGKILRVRREKGIDPERGRPDNGRMIAQMIRVDSLAARFAGEAAVVVHHYFSTHWRTHGSAAARWHAW